MVLKFFMSFANTCDRYNSSVASYQNKKSVKSPRGVNTPWQLYLCPSSCRKGYEFYKSRKNR